MRVTTKVFLASVIPPIVNVVVLAAYYFRGEIAAGNLLIGLSLLASVWLIAGVGGFIDLRLRTARRQKRHRKNST